MRVLLVCGALAVGEYAASFVPHFAEAWPVVAVGVVLAALFGYGLAQRWLGYLGVVLLGCALFLFASQDQERELRKSPWMRGKEWRCRPRQEERAGVAVVAKRDFSQRLGIGLEHDRETVSLARAILLGERRCLPSRTKRLFVESGTMHVFAISGLHVMAIAEVLTVLLGLLAVPRRFAGLVSAPLLWGYVALIGFAPSAVRAAAMATVMGLAPVFWRKADGLRAWELTFLGVHVCNPLMITNVGNALSFAVMLAIVVAGGFGKPMARWRQALLVTLAAWAAGVPISAHIFGRVTPGGLLANLVLLSAAKLAVVSGAVGLLSSCLSETLAAHFNNLSSLAIRGMVLVAEGVSRLPGANFETGRWSLSACLAWYAVCGLVVLLVACVATRRTI